MALSLAWSKPRPASTITLGCTLHTRVCVVREWCQARVWEPNTPNTPVSVGVDVLVADVRAAVQLPLVDGSDDGDAAVCAAHHDGLQQQSLDPGSQPSVGLGRDDSRVAGDDSSDGKRERGTVHFPPFPATLDDSLVVCGCGLQTAAGSG